MFRFVTCVRRLWFARSPFTRLWLLGILGGMVVLRGLPLPCLGCSQFLEALVQGMQTGLT